MSMRQNKSAQRLNGKHTFSELREIKCREWARNTELVQCLRSILAWAEEDTSDIDRINENVFDWANNIVWYAKMTDIDPVLLHKRSIPKWR